MVEVEQKYEDGSKMTKAEPGRVARHRNKVKDHRYTDKYLQGKPMPGNFTTPHVAHIEDRTEEEKEQWKMDEGGDIQEKRVISKDPRQEVNMYEDEGAGRHGKDEAEGVGRQGVYKDRDEGH